MKLMTNEDVTLTQLIDRLSAKEDPTNLKYIEYLKSKRIFNKDDRAPLSLDVYYPLLDLIKLDIMYGMIRYRCDKFLYDEFKSRTGRKRTAFHVTTEDRLAMARRLLGHCCNEEELTAIADSKTVQPYDRRSSRDKVDLLFNSLSYYFEDKLKFDTVRQVLHYKDGEEFKEIRNYSVCCLSMTLSDPVFPAVDMYEMERAIKKLIQQPEFQFKD